MSKFRIKLDFTIDVPVHPSGLSRIADFCEGGLVAIGITEGEILPGQRMRITAIREKKQRSKTP